MTKADTPANIPESIESAKAGLKEISSIIVLPAGIDLYNEFVNDIPAINNSIIATMSQTDHRPIVVFGIRLKDCFLILSFFSR